MVHSNEMEAALIIRDQESRQVTRSLPEDLKNRISGIARERRMGLSVSLNNTGDRKTSHRALSIPRHALESMRRRRLLWEPYFVEEVNFHVEYRVSNNRPGAIASTLTRKYCSHPNAFARYPVGALPMTRLNPMTLVNRAY
jgi:hypothetical protein